LAMPLSVTFLLVLLAAAAAGDCPDSSWREFEGKCYVSGFLVPWVSLPEDCRLMHPDATPVSVHSLLENSFLTTLLEGEPAWLGMNRTNAYSFVWVDGTPVDFQLWDDGEPGVRGDCVFLDSDIATGQWAVANCALRKVSVCQVTTPTPVTTTPPPVTTTPPPVTTTPPPATCPEDWTQYGDFCYWQSSPTFEVVYADVAQACRDQHPDAAGPISIHDSELNSFLASLRSGSAPWIGLTRASDSGSDWQWDDGSDVDYTPWYSDQPVDGERCAFLGAYGTEQWGSDPCSKELTFWCQLQL